MKNTPSKLFCSVALVVAAFAASSAAIAADRAAVARSQSVFMASLIDGLCAIKKQPQEDGVDDEGRAVSVPAVLSQEERDQCDYVRLGLESKCFERGDCPKYKVWLRKRAARAGL